ncbi:class I SAM-dependent methyltransferase [Ascidiimonas aurantiaca]|uniref:class I SAM-dependent methyltransferase n=1 Tax=Ascidiimonas aurantiaca TaxID=1685432 RepID=UPI0030EEAFEE
MLSKSEQSKLRNKLFRHLDGIVTGPTVYTLEEQGVLACLLSEKTASIHTLTRQFNANEGYLNVALRILCSQGWLEQEINNEKNTVTYHINDVSEIAFKYATWYKNAVHLLRLSGKYHPRVFQMEPFLIMESTFRELMDTFLKDLSSDPAERAVQEQIASHIEGMLLGPTLVHLGMTGMFHKYFMETRFMPEEFHEDPTGFGRLLDILTELNWFVKSNGVYEFTEQGLFFAKRASAYGVTVSYIPTLRKLNELLFGNPIVLKNTQKGAEEKHVDREMNVWGSGGAHAAYFKVVDEMVINLFNKPIEQQPRGILDMGCGNGAFLKHLFQVIETQTYRGTVLDEHPLTLIGVDYNEAALKVSRQNLVQADVWAKIIWGDIGNPQQLASDLKEKFNITLSDLLNVRTFLDHNRIWEEPQNSAPIRTSHSTGAYVSNGKRLPNNRVFASLKQHFEKWKPYVQEFGLLLIELHTVDPKLVAKMPGKTAATAYDATHGYSDQYILEIDEFITALKEAGLEADPSTFRKFPNSDLATVSVGLYRSL